MKAAGPSIERSTCDSAAKLTTASDRVLGEQPGAQRAVADVALHEDVVRMAAHRSEGIEIAGVGQLVEIDHALAASDGLEHEVAADEAGAAGDEQGSHETGVLDGRMTEVYRLAACALRAVAGAPGSLSHAARATGFSTSTVAPAASSSPALP